MGKSKKVAIVIIGIIIGMIAYTGYSFTSEMHVFVKDSELLEKTDKESHYTMQLEVENPSLLVLPIGKSEFVITVEDENLGTGVLNSFIVLPLGKALVEGTFTADNEVLDTYEKDDSKSVNISVITKYDMIFTSLDIPFDYEPPQGQVREFIQ